MEKGSKVIVMALVAALAIVSALLAAAIGTLVSVSDTEVDTGILSPPMNSASFLYVQHAASGTIEQENGDSTAAIYKLTLNGINNNTMSFSDRPDRTVDQITTARYVYLWTKGQDSFAADPPNAALVINAANGGEDVVVVELLNPVYDDKEQTLVYEIVALNPEEGLRGFQSSSAVPPISFDQAILFIDNGYDGNCNPVNGADLSYCNFAGAQMSDFDLSESNLTGAQMQGANLSWANLAGANLSGANLSHANLSNSELYHANLSGADLTGAVMIDADLNGCTGYDGCYNLTPS